MQVSTKIVRRNLYELNIFSRIPATSSSVSDKQRENRLNWWVEISDGNRFTYLKMMVQVVFGKLLAQDQ
jgi:hypothetical protein